MGGFYHKLKLSYKLILLFVMVSIVPIIAIQIFNYWETKKNMTRQIDKVILDNLIQISERTDLHLDSYTNMLYQIYIDDKMIDCIVRLKEPDANTMLLKSEIGGMLRNYSGHVEGIRCISIVCTDGTSVSYDVSNNSYVNTIWNKIPDMRQTPPYVETVSKPGMVITPTMKFYEEEDYNFYFHISKRMFDFAHMKNGTIATVILTLDEKLLDTICNGKEADTSAEINFIVSSEDKTVMSYPDKKFTSVRLKEEDIGDFVKRSGYLTDCSVAVNKYEDKESGWIFYNAYDEDYIMADVRESQKMIVFTGGIVLILVAVIIHNIISDLNASVQSVVSGMKEVQEGNLDVQIQIVNEDEIGTIAKNFNDMTRRIKELITQVSDAKDRQRKAEIQALEAQINPHFLYNTLDSINWMAIEHGEREISRALRDLGIILRETIKKSESMASVAQTAELLSKYMELQKMRFEDAFSYEVKVQPEIEGVEIQKLLIQPFVENAVVHGMEQVTYGGKISVHFERSEEHEYLEVSIIDNGKGMPSEMVKKYRDKRTVIEASDDKEGIGLQNALVRLHMYYGEKADWNINSAEGIGTEVTLYIPLISDKEK